MNRMLMMIIALLVAAGTAAAAPATKPVAKAPRPAVAVEMKNCTTAECHADVKNYKLVHGPVNVDACDACHKLADAKTHKFEMVRQGQEMCTFCHQVDTKAFPVMHKPVQEGQCVGCHNPHGGTTKAFVFGATTAELCARCHEDPMKGKKQVHGPVGAGACESCHQSHGAKHKKLLVAEGKELCLSCHTDTKAQLAKAKFVHEPVKGECSACHDAHASNFAMQIKQSPSELCASCHQKEVTLANSAKYKHTVVTKDNACANCHTAHGGDLADLMKQEPAKMCMSCHDKPIMENGQQKVAAVAEVGNKDLVKHGPIRDGNCSGCHSTHGAEHDALLTKAYPAQFYQKFEEQKYDLCFTCHDKQLVLHKDAKGLTNFRNGQSNLHYVHVNKEKGRSCRACHSTHASPNELHVRETTPYGNWQMPIKFTKTQTGGSCSPGCHKPYDYDREKPVSYSATGTAAPAAPVKASAGPTPATATPQVKQPAPATVTPPQVKQPEPAPAPEQAPAQPKPAEPTTRRFMIRN